MTPEYAHVLLNPIPVYGLAMGIFLLILSLIRSSPEFRITGLIIVMLSCAAAGPVMELGEKGYDRISSISNTDGQKWLETHAKRAGTAESIFYIAAGICLATLVASKKKPSVVPALTRAALVISVLCLGLSGWIAKAGGQIRHQEFRSGPP